MRSRRSGPPAAERTTASSARCWCRSSTSTSACRRCSTTRGSTASWPRSWAMTTTTRPATATTTSATRSGTPTRSRDDPHESLKIAFYLDPVTRDTGCLRVIPGSVHPATRSSRRCTKPCRSRRAAGPRSSGASPAADVPAYPIESEPGDMLLFNHRIKHSSWGGGDRRRMFTLNMEARYDEADLPALREKIASDATGREANMTRGLRRGDDPDGRARADAPPRAAPGERRPVAVMSAGGAQPPEPPRTEFG